jgi:hypothetical protein
MHYAIVFYIKSRLPRGLFPATRSLIERFLSPPSAPFRPPLRSVGVIRNSLSCNSRRGSARSRLLGFVSSLFIERN